MTQKVTPKKQFVVCTYTEKPGILQWFRRGSIDDVKNIIRRLRDEDIYYLGVSASGGAMPTTFVVYHQKKDELVCPKDQAFLRLSQASVQI